jgi:hypothetical protein
MTHKPDDETAYKEVSKHQVERRVQLLQPPTQFKRFWTEADDVLNVNDISSS